MDVIGRAVAWVKDDGYGHEFVDVTIRGDVMVAKGIAIGTAPVPYRLDYRLETGPRFVTARLSAATHGDGWSRSLDLRQADGRWTASTTSDGDVDLPPAGGDVEAVRGALDCDLEMSPVTNSMPVLRHDLLSGGEPREFLMAWVALPALSFGPSRSATCPWVPCRMGSADPVRVARERLHRRGVVRSGRARHRLPAARAADPMRTLDAVARRMLRSGGADRT